MTLVTTSISSSIISSGCLVTPYCFDGEGYETYGGKKGESYILSFRVVAMGDLNAVDIAQQVHFEILQDGLCMQPGERIEFKQPLPASHTFLKACT